MNNLMKNPTTAAILTFAGTATGIFSLIWIITLVSGTGIAEVFDAFLIVICVLCCTVDAIRAFLKAKKNLEENQQIQPTLS